MKSLYSILFFMFIVFGSYAKSEKQINLLVFSKTNGFRHESIPTGIKALEKMAAANNWSIYATEASTHFTAENLANYDLIIFLGTSGDVFNAAEKSAIKNYVENGKGLLTIHSGTNTEEQWPWYVNAVGGIFLGHPPTQKATVVIENSNHPSTQHFPAKTWEVVDEWYSFDRNPRENVHVLVSIDESTYEVDDNKWFPGKKQRMGDHPIVWYNEVGKGIVFQTALGHTPEMYAEPYFLQHLKGSINWLIKQEN